ncbi:MAG: hypothetical protein B7Y90_09010 [Alphaproteobacteria bacterium 32-64-14]|nr:MAG: hypothetical protein B7Y90_09010 [Alphaproteobacteria bacterium 32-64-14]
MIRTLLLAFVLIPAAYAQASDIPRTADGRPDFQGYWSNEFLTPLERIKGASALVISDAEAETLVDGIRAERATDKFEEATAVPEAKQLARVRGEWRTSLIFDPPDGLLPLTPRGQAQRAAFPVMNDRTAGNPEERGNTERCLAGPSRAPILIPVEGMFNQIVQTPDAFVFLPDHFNDVRIVRIGGKHGPAELTSWVGDSIANWDGDTLVVETTHLRPDESARQRVVMGPQSRVVERFRYVSPNELLYQFTIEDFALYAQPWKAEYSFTRTTLPPHEFGCHEGNHGLEGILRGARVAEERAIREQSNNQPAPKAKP